MLRVCPALNADVGILADIRAAVGMLVGFEGSDWLDNTRATSTLLNAALNAATNSNATATAPVSAPVAAASVPIAQAAVVAAPAAQVAAAAPVATTPLAASTPPPRPVPRLRPRVVSPSAELENDNNDNIQLGRRNVREVVNVDATPSPQPANADACSDNEATLNGQEEDKRLATLPLPDNSHIRDLYTWAL